MLPISEARSPQPLELKARILKELEAQKSGAIANFSCDDGQSSIFHLCEIVCDRLSVRLEAESQPLEQLDAFKKL
jgi:hypothetical protein